MTRQEFIKLVGAHVLHVTAHQNRSGIVRHGLVPPAEMGAQETLTLRDDRYHVKTADYDVLLNHQRPLLAGRNSAQEFLDGHSLESWAAQLDERVFFWPERGGRAFSDSLEGIQTSILKLDAGVLFDARYQDIFLSPINSGSALRKPAKRGDWIYTSVTEGIEAFRFKRVHMGLVQRPDRVMEISVKGAVAAETLNLERR